MAYGQLSAAGHTFEMNEIIFCFQKLFSLLKLRISILSFPCLAFLFKNLPSISNFNVWLVRPQSCLANWPSSAYAVANWFWHSSGSAFGQVRIYSGSSTRPSVIQWVNGLPVLSLPRPVIALQIQSGRAMKGAYQMESSLADPSIEWSKVGVRHELSSPGVFVVLCDSLHFR